ncbi:MAG: DUF4013 domain-containing protein [Eggerthellaceae bacterium]|nr:DUF4013 domain-containing protein [Eggerthellaceae bacterium]
MTEYHDQNQPGAQPAAPTGTSGAAQPVAPADGQPQQPGTSGTAPTDAQSGYQAPQPQQPHAYQVPPQPQYQPAPAQPVYAEGCVKAAWNDVTASEGWKGRMLVLGLIGCVPILNFTVYGYGLNWSREVPFGAKTPLPRTMVNGRNFEYGFYFFLLSLVFGLVTGIASSIVGWVPLIGWVAAMALMLVCYMFETLLGLRMAMMGSLGEGFQIGKAWDVMKRNWTGLLCAAVVPTLIVGIVMTVVGVVLSIMGAIGLIGPMASLASGYGSAAAMAAGSMGIAIVLLVIVWVLLCMGASTMALVVTFRAVGHWIGRYAPEWCTDAWRAAEMRR